MVYIFSMGDFGGRWARYKWDAEVESWIDVGGKARIVEYRNLFTELVKILQSKRTEYLPELIEKEFPGYSPQWRKKHATVLNEEVAKAINIELGHTALGHTALDFTPPEVSEITQFKMKKDDVRSLTENSKLGRYITNSCKKIVMDIDAALKKTVHFLDWCVLEEATKLKEALTDMTMKKYIARHSNEEADSILARNANRFLRLVEYLLKNSYDRVINPVPVRDPVPDPAPDPTPAN